MQCRVDLSASSADRLRASESPSAVPTAFPPGSAKRTIDSLCYGYDEASKAFVSSQFACPSTPAHNPHNETDATSLGVSIERKPGGWAGNCLDTSNNANDFGVSSPANPQNLASAVTAPMSN